MSLKSSLFFLIQLFVNRMRFLNSDIELKDVSYRGISLTWRRLNAPLETNEIFFEFRIEMSLTDVSMSLCHIPNEKGERLSSNFAIRCIDSWDRCVSWPSHRLKIFCYSRHRDLLKVLIRDRIHLSLNNSVGVTNLFYEIEYPQKNVSCCWLNFPLNHQEKVHLTSYLKLIDPTKEKMNNPPIIRFPEEISINIHEEFSYSLHVFDPDGDLFHCQLKSSSIDFLLVETNCLLKFDRSKGKLSHHQYLLQIELIEYFREDKSQIRSRLPFQILLWIVNDPIDSSSEHCRQSTSMNLLNIQSDFVDLSINQTIDVNVIYRSQCEISSDQCVMNSLFQWKIIKIHQRTSLINDDNQTEIDIEIEYEWIPKTIDHCSYHLHCIRCWNHFDYFIEKCFYTFVQGNLCHRLHLDRQGCSWSPFTIWKKFNQTFYQRQRFCRQINDQKKDCSFCFGSSIEYQSILAFRKDFELFEESLLSPTRAKSTVKVLLISTIVWIGTFLLALLFSLVLQFKRKKTIR